MVMPLSGTFDYTGVIPEDWRHHSWKLTDRSCSADPSMPNSLRRFIETTSKVFSAFKARDPLTDNRLVGIQPVLEISENQMKLSASSRFRAELSSVSMQVDPKLIEVFRAGDIIHLRRVNTGDIGISLLRKDNLIFALGAVTTLALGTDVSVASGPKLDFMDQSTQENWLDVSISDETLRLGKGLAAVLGDYSFTTHRCFEQGMPGRYECVAISRNGVCPHEAAANSAKLMDRGLTMTDWRGAVFGHIPEIHYQIKYSFDDQQSQDEESAIAVLRPVVIQHCTETATYGKRIKCQVNLIAPTANHATVENAIVKLFEADPEVKRMYAGAIISVSLFSDDQSPSRRGTSFDVSFP